MDTITWTRVQVQALGEGDYYDFTVPEYHNYYAQGMWHHNSGKTAAAAKYVHDIVHGPPMISGVPGGHWLAIVGPTLGDAVTACVLGPSGLRKWDPGIKVLQQAGGTICRWSNGVEAKLFGAHSPDDVERFRAGGNRSLVWCDEFASWRYQKEAWEQIRYGLRVGLWPHCIISTTPKNRPTIKEIVKQAMAEANMPDPTYVVTRAQTADNPYLDERVKRMLYADYQGTRMGRQELAAEILEDVEGALWNEAMIAQYRLGVQSFPETLQQTVVAVDPQAKEGAAETGIVVVGSVNKWAHGDERPHGFILGDCSIDGSPQKWGQAVVDAYHDYECDRVVCEINNGGDMVAHVIRQIDSSIPIKVVHASRGKAKRAEPVSGLYEQGRIHHVGFFPELEEEMVTWDPIESGDDESPNRMDAMVWGVHATLLAQRQARQRQMVDTRLRGRR